jgi:hypothetical protein
VLLACLLTLAAASDARLERLRFGDAVLEIELPSPLPGIGREALAAWIETAGRAVSSYLGRFPVPRATLRVVSGRREGVGSGMTWGRGGGLIRIAVGRDVTQSELANDWVLTHEMVHLGFPDLDDEQHWMEEGLATYVEPIARVRIGALEADGMWRGLIDGLPNGEPESDRPLNGTRSWGRTYWGGALFWLQADVQIRERTASKRGLEDALAGIIARGGTIRADWTVERTMSVGDSAIGTSVLQPLYEKMGRRGARTDLAALLEGLGVRSRDGGVAYDDKAPLAAIRQAITRGRRAPEAKE